MFAAAVHAVVCLLLALWGGLVAALIGWILYSMIVDTAAGILPGRFPVAARYLRRVRRRRQRSVQRALGREHFNRRMPLEYSEACFNAIIELIERGHDKTKPKS